MKHVLALLLVLGITPACAGADDVEESEASRDAASACRDRPCGAPAISAELRVEAGSYIRVPDFDGWLYVYVTEIEETVDLWLIEGVYGPALPGEDGRVSQETIEDLSRADLRNLIMTQLQLTGAGDGGTFEVKRAPHTVDVLRIDRPWLGTPSVSVRIRPYGAAR